MKERDTTSWSMLNAYVDGELEAEQAAQVAAAIAADRGLAAQVATLTRLRATLRAMPADDAVPAFVLAPGGTRLWSWRRPAVAILVACSIGGGWLALHHGTPTAMPIADAVAAHRLWLSQAPSAQTQRLGVELAGADVDALPDLSLASLRLVHLSLDPSARAGGGILAGYVGPNGCRVGLWIAPVDAMLPERPDLRDREGFAIRAWRGSHASYALIGQGIDPARFDGIAALVARLTLDDRSVPREQIAALAEARTVKVPCLA